MALLGGNRGDVLKALSLIDSDAAAGDADAVERKALLEAIGCERRQDWSRALDCLQAAAERGCEAAQAQMRLLADGSATSGQDWAAVRSRIALDKLTQSPRKRPLCESPRLRIIDGFASKAECVWLIERALARLQPAKVVTAAGSHTVEEGRSNSAIGFQLTEMDLVVEMLRTRIASATHLPLPLFEPAQVLHYAPGQQFEAHHDYFDPELPGHAEQLKSGQRIATFLIYLNDDYAGGETAFPRAGISFRGKTGDALFLANVERSGRPDPSTLHAGMPPISGEKWLFSQWICDRPAAGAAHG